MSRNREAVTFSRRRHRSFLEANWGCSGQVLISAYLKEELGLRRQGRLWRR
jgi:hypothetical protein